MNSDHIENFDGIEISNLPQLVFALTRNNMSGLHDLLRDQSPEEAVLYLSQGEDNKEAFI